jgi:hypothetical protein
MAQTWRLMRLTAFTLLTALSIAGAPPLTIIQDVLYKANGARFDGIAQISWNTFQAADGSEVPKQLVNLRVINGNLRALLVPTTNALQPVTYTVKFNADGHTQFVETWAVPPSAAPLKLRDVRVTSTAPGNVEEGPSGPIDISDVIGLRTELDLRPAKGASYVPSRSAVINNAGAIDAALGNPGDCLRVDGTTSPCGTGGLLFIDGETPTGTINGVNTAFTLSAAPSPVESLTLFRNGMLLRLGVDFTVSDKTVVMAPGNAPAIGDRLEAWYRLPPSGTPVISFIDAETPAGVVNGVNTVFTLSAAPLPASSLRVFRNGLLQKQGVDYIHTVNTITFTQVSIPVAGDILQVSYRRE